MKVYDVIKGSKYRFRVINAGTVNSMRVSIDDHKLYMIATDGYDTEPLEVESFFINPGERFDFYIIANRPTKSYFIRSDTLVVSNCSNTVQPKQNPDQSYNMCIVLLSVEVEIKFVREFLCH